MENHTPMKHTEENDPNEYYEIGYTSGKKIKGISQNVYHSNRCPLPAKKNFMPFRIVSEQQETKVLEFQNEANMETDKEDEELDRMIEEKMKKFMQKQENVGQRKIAVQNYLNQLAEAKRKQGQLIDRLYAIKRYQASQAQIYEFHREKNHSDVQFMRKLLQRSDKEMFNANRVIFATEKEHQSIQKNITMSESKIQALKAKIKVKQENVKKLMEAEKELQTVLDQKKRVNQVAKEALNDHILQLAVLKMQLNQYLRVGFEALKGDQDVKKKILEKNPNLWQKKSKVLHNEEILYYILLQLYPSWHKLLNELSYHFIGYKQLLFQPNLKETDMINNLENYIFNNFTKKAANKEKSFIVLYSPLEETNQELRRILLSLNGINNGIIHIYDASIIKNETNEEFVVTYSFKGQEKVKIFDLVRLQELTKESLQPYIPRGGDKTSIIKIEIPFCYENSAERQKMEEIYRLIERER